MRSGWAVLRITTIRNGLRFQRPAVVETDQARGGNRPARQDLVVVACLPPTNNTALPALTICALCKSRWQVELFFVWIKQQLRIKHFLGNSENAVKTQVWCAVATCVLIAIVRKQLQIEAPMYICIQILSVSAFEKARLSCALADDASSAERSDDAKQVTLFISSGQS